MEARSETEAGLSHRFIAVWVTCPICLSRLADQNITRKFLEETNMGPLTTNCWRLFQNLEWVLYNKMRRAKLIREDFTIIASNCNGTMIYHDLGLPFLSPTINLTISAPDFVKLAEDLRYYMAQPLAPLESTEAIPCPRGLLGDLSINFVHYKTFEEGRDAWERRKARINWENLFFICSDKDGGTYDVIRRFDRLPHPHKVIFTYQDYPEFSSSFRLPGFEELGHLGTTTNYRPGLLKRRYLDSFDYISFLNGKWPG